MDSNNNGAPTNANPTNANSDEQGYNGWKNYETWLVNIHLSQDEGTHTYWGEQALEAYRGLSPDKYTDTDNQAKRKSRAAVQLAQQIQETLSDTATEIMEQARGAAYLFSDLLNSALENVDWREIARHYVDGLSEDSLNAADEEREGFPTVEQLASCLERYKPGPNDFDDDDDDDNEDERYWDIRLQVYGGEYCIHTSDSSCDQDHRGYWGSSCIGPDTDCKELAQELLDQATDHYWMSQG